MESNRLSGTFLISIVGIDSGNEITQMDVAVVLFLMQEKGFKDMYWVRSNLGEAITDYLKK